jgi:hypothetical protein
MNRHGMNPGDVSRGAIGYSLVACLITALGLVVVFGLGMALTARNARPNRLPSAAARPAAPYAPRFILNALLLPALDGDAVPLRWVDPRPILNCGANTAVRVNRGPLLAGALVPEMPFELEWLADGCRPFGAHGPRFDGRVKLTVFSEDWGVSAMVEPSGLRITSGEQVITCIGPGAAWLPETVDVDDSFVRTVADADRELRCRTPGLQHYGDSRK